jgi:hypothetical protein
MPAVSSRLRGRGGCKPLRAQRRLIGARRIVAGIPWRVRWKLSMGPRSTSPSDVAQFHLSTDPPRQCRRVETLSSSPVSRKFILPFASHRRSAIVQGPHPAGFSLERPVTSPGRSLTPITGRVQVSEQYPRLPEQPTSIALTECSGRARPFLRFMTATDHTRHPSGSSARRTSVACRPGGPICPPTARATDPRAGVAVFACQGL